MSRPRQGLEKCLTEKSADWYWEDGCLIPIAEALYDTETHISSVTHWKQFQLPVLQSPLWKQDHLVLTVPLVSHKDQSHWHSGACPGALIMGTSYQTLRRGTSQYTVAASV